MSQEKAFEIVIDEFMKISEIPRPSHHEKQISEYLYQWAKNRNLQVERDDLNEIIIDKPATPGYENKPLTIFQAHMDMVCVAEEGLDYDPLKDPIKVINDGVTLTADGTSLGADNGIGVALCLYLLQDNTLKHGPIRAIITTNEEDGMDSINIDKKYLQGDYLVNLDWETVGSLCNSCAGGAFFDFTRKSEWEETPANYETLTISFSNLLGGHSGVGINKGHANALVSIATALTLLKQGGVDYRIADLSGGQAVNAIPKFAKANLVIFSEDIPKAKSILDQFYAEFKDSYDNIETEYSFNITDNEIKPEKVLTREAGYALAEIMALVPNNVHTMSPFVENLVESSANLGIISIDNEQIELKMLARSSSVYQQTQLTTICQALSDAYKFEFQSRGQIPGWAVNPNSKLVPLALEAYEKLTGDTMIVEPIHASVECGAFVAKNPKLDMISIGPTMEDVHTPNEKCYIKDIKIIIDLLVEILEKIAK